MNETSDRQRERSDSDGFDARRLRTITDMHRSTDDRMLAGVCAGAARYLNVDPVVVRVVIAVLTLVGAAGLILYLAAWFLLPADDTGQSIAADWFNLDRNEEQVRVVGLVVAAVLAALAVVGDNGWGGWAWWGLPWVIVPLAILYWLFAVRPRRRRDGRAETLATTTAADAPATGVEDTAVLPAADTSSGDPVGPTPPTAPAKRPKPRTPGGMVLTGLTLSIAAIAVAITVLVDGPGSDPSWTTYVVVALGVVTAGVLVGMFFGRPGPLIPVGLLLTLMLAVGLLMPSPGMGDKRIAPTSASALEGEYKNGLGTIRLDLTHLTDAEQLLGSTIRLENGAGDIKVTVPDDLNVAIDAEVDAGEVRALGRKSTGTDAGLDLAPDDPSQPALTLQLRQNVGGIEVIER